MERIAHYKSLCSCSCSRRSFVNGSYYNQTNFKLGYKMSLNKNFDSPSNWCNQITEVEEIELESHSSEYRTVKKMLTGDALNHLIKITRIQNPFLYKRYMLRKLEYVARGICHVERKLFHATAESKIHSIIKDNLDWRMVVRAKFGRGVSFSPSAIYANRECSRSNGLYRAMIVAKVIIGRECAGFYSTQIPSRRYDTTIGNRGNVYVKYYDDEFYPEYVAYYHL